MEILHQQFALKDFGVRVEVNVGRALMGILEDESLHPAQPATQALLARVRCAPTQVVDTVRCLEIPGCTVAVGTAFVRCGFRTVPATAASALFVVRHIFRTKAVAATGTSLLRAVSGVVVRSIARATLHRENNSLH
jgi:hypothetical protein